MIGSQRSNCQWFGKGTWSGMIPRLLRWFRTNFTVFVPNRPSGVGSDPNLFCHLSGRAAAGRSPGARLIHSLVSKIPGIFPFMFLKEVYLIVSSFTNLDRIRLCHKFQFTMTNRMSNPVASRISIYQNSNLCHQFPFTKTVSPVSIYKTISKCHHFPFTNRHASVTLVSIYKTISKT